VGLLFGERALRCRVGNKAWLTTAARRLTFPRLQEPHYDAARHTVACCTWGIPLLWLPLFRLSDFLVEDVTVEPGRTYRDPAPVVGAPTALARLAGAVPRLNAVFHEQGSLDRHAAMLGEAIVSTGRPFLTLEAEELAWSGEPGAFYGRLERTLAYFERPDSPAGRGDLLYLTPTVSEPDMPFPQPEEVWQGEETDIEVVEMLRFLLGERWERQVPWEPSR
jgi:hypothetical protein